MGQQEVCTAIGRLASLNKHGGDVLFAKNTLSAEKRLKDTIGESMKAVRLPRVIDALQIKAMTAPELALKVFCTERSAQQMINKLRVAGNVHIQTWRKVNTVWVAVYRYGIGSDAVKPKPLTAYERLVRHREKESLDDKAFRLARERGKRLKPRRDPLVAMFYGNGYSNPDD
jgi:hypothetical protein